RAAAGRKSGYGDEKCLRVVDLVDRRKRADADRSIDDVHWSRAASQVVVELSAVSGFARALESVGVVRSDLSRVRAGKARPGFAGRVRDDRPGGIIGIELGLELEGAAAPQRKRAPTRVDSPGPGIER